MPQLELEAMIGCKETEVFRPHGKFNYKRKGRRFRAKHHYSWLEVARLWDDSGRYRKDLRDCTIREKLFSPREVIRQFGIYRADSEDSVSLIVKIPLTQVSTDKLERICSRFNAFFKLVFDQMGQECIIVRCQWYGKSVRYRTLRWDIPLRRGRGRRKHDELKPSDLQPLPGVTAPSGDIPYVSSFKGASINWVRLLRSAQHHIFIGGQNLRGITGKKNRARHGRFFLRFLRDDSRRKIDILICDQTEESALETWGRFLHAKQKYRRDLKASEKVFLEWRKDAGKNFRVKRTLFFPFGICFLDPKYKDNKTAVMVITPVLERGSKSRRSFVLRKDDDPSAFKYYWERIQKIFKSHSQSA